MFYIIAEILFPERIMHKKFQRHYSLRNILFILLLKYFNRFILKVSEFLEDENLMFCISLLFSLKAKKKRLLFIFFQQPKTFENCNSFYLDSNWKFVCLENFSSKMHLFLFFSFLFSFRFICMRDFSCKM